LLTAWIPFKKYGIYLKNDHLFITDGKENGESNSRIQNGNAVGDGGGLNLPIKLYAKLLLAL